MIGILHYCPMAGKVSGFGFGGLKAEGFVACRFGFLGLGA